MNKYNNNLNCSVALLDKFKLKLNIINELDKNDTLINTAPTK